jgi:hypothetical protein
MCRVVHFKKDDYDIYIGRLPNNEYNKWAYPKELRETFPEGTPRQEIIDAYEDYLLSKPELMKDLHELKYKTLGCWCKNKGGGGKSCHGDILKKYVDKLEKIDERKNLLNG